MTTPKDIDPHRCAHCGADAWESPAVAADGRAVRVVSLHLTPGGAICPRGAFAVDEPAPTPERQRRWCVDAAVRLFAAVTPELAAALTLSSVLETGAGLAAGPVELALELLADAHAEAERRIALRDGADERRTRGALRLEAVCRALARAGLTWQEVDPAARFGAWVELAERMEAMERAEEEARILAFSKPDRRPS